MQLDTYLVTSKPLSVPQELGKQLQLPWQLLQVPRFQLLLQVIRVEKDIGGCSRLKSKQPYPLPSRNMVSVLLMVEQLDGMH